MTNINKIIIYQPSEENYAIEVLLENETVWLTQAQMVELFDRNQSVISRHIRNIFNEEELDSKSNMHFCILQTQINLLHFTVLMLSYLSDTALNQKEEHSLEYGPTKC